MAPSMEYSFHEDLIMEFLLRLPVKPLLRFRAVSKPWLSLISSPNFIHSHLGRRATTSKQSDETLVLNQDGATVSLISLNSCLIGDTPEVSDNRGDHSLLVVGSCNGIICASVTKHKSKVCGKICLWNPATKHYKLIPRRNVPEKGSFENGSLGFGFDPIGDDFKIIRVISDDGIPYKAIWVELYSLNRNSWRRVEPNPTDCPEYVTFDGCLRGLLYFTGWDSLITFDLHKEVFNCGIRFPPTCDDFDQLPCVTEYKDLIAVVSFLNDNGSSKIKLWTLDDACLHGGMEEPWTLIFSFDLALGYIHDVCGCFNNGDIIPCVSSDKDALWRGDVYFLCNPENGESKIVHFPKFYGKIFRHIESLVSIKGSKQVMCDSNTNDNLGRQLFWYSDYHE